MPCVCQSDECIDVQKILHGKSTKAAFTSSEVTFVPAGDLVIRSPEIWSRKRRGALLAECCGVRTIDGPCTLQSNFTPGRRRSRRRACLGKTTWPLLDNFVVIRLTVLPSGDQVNTFTK